MALPEPKESIPGGKKPPVAFFIWFILFIVIFILFIYKYNNSGKVENWDQAKFEREVKAERVLSAEFSPQGENIYDVEGNFKLSKTETAAKERQEGKAKVSTGRYRTRVVLSKQLNELLQANVKEVKIHKRDNWWSLVLTMLPVILIIVVIYVLFSRQIKMAGRGAMQFGKSRAKMIMPDELHITFDDVAGADEAKEEIQEIVEFLKDPLKFQMLGAKIPKGALLTGAPGTGKTLLAKAVACEAEVPFFSISGSDFVEMFVGVGASRVRDMFEQARRHAPCLIFIDEIDAVGRSRFSGMGGGHDEREQTLNAMLVEMDGLESANAGVIVLAATNRPDVLDPALLRPGRFDRQVVLDLPDIRGRKKIIEIHIARIKIDKSVQIDILARSTPGFSGADLANMCNEGALLAARYDREAATQDDLEEARDKVRWGRERKSRRITPHEKKLTAYHEAGHALATLHCKLATPLHKVTIIPRGQALGMTMMMPDEDVYTRNRKELLDEMVVLYAGRVAERMIFDDMNSGASNDIERATKIARMMVCTFGMTDEIGPIHYGDRHEHIHVRIDAIPADSYSQETAREIDVEVRKLIDGTLQRCKDILTRNRFQLEKLAEELLDKETLAVDEVYVLLNMEPRKLVEVDLSDPVEADETPVEETPEVEAATPEDNSEAVEEKSEQA
jgi:cell division protease FtsH